MENVEVHVTADNAEEAVELMRAAIARGLEEVGLAAEGHAKAACPVDTGRLRNSITHAMLGGSAVAIGTNVEYAPHVELGTSKQRKQPFLAPAASEHAPSTRPSCVGRSGGAEEMTKQVEQLRAELAKAQEAGEVPQTPQARPQCMGTCDAMTFIWWEMAGTKLGVSSRR